MTGRHWLASVPRRPGGFLIRDEVFQQLCAEQLRGFLGVECSLHVTQQLHTHARRFALQAMQCDCCGTCGLRPVWSPA